MTESEPNSNNEVYGQQEKGWAELTGMSKSAFMKKWDNFEKNIQNAAKQSTELTSESTDWSGLTNSFDDSARNDESSRADGQLEAEARTSTEAEDMNKHEAEARARAEAEEKDKSEQEAFASKIAELGAIAAEKQAEKDAFENKIKELDDIAKEKLGTGQAEMGQKIEELDQIIKQKQAEEAGPLVAINADFTADKKDLAHDFAERELNDEVAHSNFIKKIWKGTLFKKYYQKKYEQEIYSGDRKVTHHGERVDLDDIIDNDSDNAIKRFVMSTTEGYEKMVHEQAGEKRVEADARTTEVVKSAIEWYASAKIPEDGSAEELMAEFGNRIKRLQAEGHDDGQPINEKLINNYFDVATQARERAEHGAAMERIMEGFKVYNAKVRDGIRSEAHRDNLDKIIGKLEESKVGNFISSPVLAAAVGAAWGLTQSGSRALAGPLGGLGVSGVIAGLKERNHVTEDRIRMMRDVAQNYQYEGQQEEQPKGKRAKYEARIGGTMYDMRPASELTESLSQAIESGDREGIMKAIAEARVRIDLSDSEGKDLISYSSADNIGTERLNLDIALIRAEKGLSDEDKASLALQKSAIQDDIMEDIDASDRDFIKLRTAQALKQAGKSIAIGSVFFFGSQEIMAAMDPGKIGLLEKVGILKTANRDDASETILASLAGPRGFSTSTIDNISGDDAASIKRYKDAGYEQVQTKQAWSETKQDLVDVKPKSSTNRIKAIYDGWANNGTKGADGNELNIEVRNNAFVSNMAGNSTMGGQNFDYNQLAKAGNIKGYITIGGAKFEVASSVNSAGQLTWPIDANGAITTTTGESIKAIGNNGEKLFKYFEVALDNGVDANGFTHIMPFATEVGSDSFKGTIQQVAETVVEHPATYSFVKHIPHDIYYGGVAMPGITARTGLGTATASNVPPTAPISISETPTPAPAPSSTPAPAPTATSSQIISASETPAASEAPTTSEEAPAQPEPIPTATIERQPVEPTTTTTTAEAEPTTPGQNTEAEPTVPANNQTIERLRNYIGEDGASYLASREPFNGEENDIQFSSWWGALPEENRELVLGAIPILARDGLGRALYVWLQNQGQLPLGPIPSAN